MTLSGRIPPAPDDDDDKWMATFRTLPDDEIDALLRGDSTSPVAGGLTELVQELRADVGRHGVPPMTAALRAQIARPAPVAASTRRRRMLAGGLGGLLLGGATMGVAAAQEALPAPIQDATAAVAGVLGVDLPRTTESDAPADDGGSGRPTDTTTGATDPAPSGDEPTDTIPAEEPSSTPGPPDSTPGGAAPADPGVPGDKEPAVPATPATGNGQGNGNSNGNGNGNGDNGQGNGSGKGNSASETGRENGQGTAKP